MAEILEDELFEFFLMKERKLFGNKNPSSMKIEWSKNAVLNKIKNGEIFPRFCQREHLLFQTDSLIFSKNQRRVENGSIFAFFLFQNGKMP
jgi:hypothetical protein